ncbi:MAG: hypothetical protein R3362_00195, partial [Rhodothermales bacterium]|nr:hypothetical protein [Rhodothermales bacterium]
ATTTATVAVPTEPPATVSDPQPFGEAVTQRVVLDGLVAAPEAARVVWLVDPAGAPPAEVAFAEEPSRVAEGQRFVFSLTRHADVVRRELGLPAEDSTSAALLGLRLRYRLVTEAVAGSGGLGALGAVGAYEVAWTLPDTLVQAFGFRVPAREPRRGRTAGRDAK